MWTDFNNSTTDEFCCRKLPCEI